MVKVEKFLIVPVDYTDTVSSLLGRKTSEILDLAMSFVKNDYVEELSEIINDIVYEFEKYDLDDDDMFELFREYYNFNDILWGSRDFGQQLVKWITDDFFYKLNRNEIKIIDLQKDEESENE